MNFLAHAYLSFGNPDILVGNMVSDFVKGRRKFSYSTGIQKGFTLHRIIDQFTDDHPVTKQAKEIFRPYYRLYSGPIIDILYDHFLAIDENSFPNQSLAPFASSVYTTLEEYNEQLPSGFLKALAYMKADNWLYNYSTNAGMERSLAGLVRRSSFLTESETAYRLFQQNYELLKKHFQEFFPDVKDFAKLNFDQII